MTSEYHWNIFFLSVQFIFLIWVTQPQPACPTIFVTSLASTAAATRPCSVFPKFHICFYIRGLAFTLSSCQENSVPSFTLRALVGSHLSNTTRSWTLPGVLSQVLICGFYSVISFWCQNNLSGDIRSSLVYAPEQIMICVQYHVVWLYIGASVK